MPNACVQPGWKHAKKIPGSSASKMVQMRLFRSIFLSTREPFSNQQALEHVVVQGRRLAPRLALAVGGARRLRRRPVVSRTPVHCAPARRNGGADVLEQRLQMKRHLLEFSVRYVCPEPVLANER